MSAPEQQPPADPVPPRHRIGTAGFLVGTALAVVVIGLLATLVTWRFHPAPKPPCVADCGPISSRASSTGAALPEQRTYRSSKDGFEVDYPASWSVAQSGSDFVFLVTDGGDGLIVQAGPSGATPRQLVLEAPSLLNQTRFPDVRPDHEIRGARIGAVAGVGIVYSATHVPDSGGGQAEAVRLPAVAATHGGLSILALGIAPYDPSVPGGVGSGADLDYALTELRWPGGG